LTSTDGNGFRYGLRNQLIYGGNPVNMIGSVQSGNMADNDVEGWPGYTIDQVASMAENSISNKPNVILLHVGTNDMIQNNDVANAHNRLATLIDRLISAIPDVTIIASTLLPNGNSGVQPRADVYNKNIAGIVKSRQAAGKKILHVDFSSSYFTLADIGSDG
jgi:lysophospholipase L1-like esterase